jgi:phage-related protein
MNPLSATGPYGSGSWGYPCRIGRVIFCVARERMVLLHSFVKKTQKTPAQDLRLALKRMKEVL